MSRSDQLAQLQATGQTECWLGGHPIAGSAVAPVTMNDPTKPLCCRRCWADAHD